MEVLWQAGIFFSFGLICQYWSHRTPLEGYGYPRVLRPDLLFFALGLSLDSLTAFGMAPVAQYVLALVPTVVEPLRKSYLGLGSVLQAIVFIVAADFMSYWGHRLLHTKTFWPWHAFHHSAKSLNWYSGMRGSAGHYLIVGTPYAVMGALTLLSGEYMSFYLLIMIGGWTQNTIHSSIHWPHARRIENLIVTPAMHFIHHHPNPVYTDTNFGNTFAIWDKLFGTYQNPDLVDENQRGITGLDYEIDTASLLLGWELTERVYPEKPVYKKSA